LYSINLASCDNDLFLQLKEELRGCHFRNAGAVQMASYTALQVMHHGFQKCFKQLYKSWWMCVVAAVAFKANQI
jgi:hypothetical protein